MEKVAPLADDEDFHSGDHVASRRTLGTGPQGPARIRAGPDRPSWLPARIDLGAVHSPPVEVPPVRGSVGAARRTTARSLSRRPNTDRPSDARSHGTSWGPVLCSLTSTTSTHTHTGSLKLPAGPDHRACTRLSESSLAYCDGSPGAADAAFSSAAAAARAIPSSARIAASTAVAVRRGVWTGLVAHTRSSSSVRTSRQVKRCPAGSRPLCGSHALPAQRSAQLSPSAAR